ncbi:MAG: hypothetical protein KKB90_12670 [Actinobacteria bacterium]|nr:hypothetical protein [Actinomycetota bacterium]MCG2819702.1 hypothetical protein [Actinomycetes bacterium]MBU4219794.1 hypothetical protein [Actinomycetota bacterium]MBU4357979.1 hypothetical protein [Actinomycetota bacterium]MBU4391007.1 hypothetical protein [Actinomycetota bacterium]
MKHTINMNNTEEAPGGRLSPDNGLEGVQARVKEAAVYHRQEKEVNSKAGRTDDKQSKRHPLGGGKGKKNGEV